LQVDAKLATWLQKHEVAVADKTTQAYPSPANHVPPPVLDAMGNPVLNAANDPAGPPVVIAAPDAMANAVANTVANAAGPPMANPVGNAVPNPMGPPMLPPVGTPMLPPVAPVEALEDHLANMMRARAPIIYQQSVLPPLSQSNTGPYTGAVWTPGSSSQGV
jgi:hypothetical protein